jgi:hypothetical protein
MAFAVLKGGVMTGNTVLSLLIPAVSLGMLLTIAASVMRAERPAGKMLPIQMRSDVASAIKCFLRRNEWIFSSVPALSIFIPAATRLHQERSKR